MKNPASYTAVSLLGLIRNSFISTTDYTSGWKKREISLKRAGVRKKYSAIDYVFMCE